MKIETLFAQLRFVHSIEIFHFSQIHNAQLFCINLPMLCICIVAELHTTLSHFLSQLQCKNAGSCILGNGKMIQTNHIKNSFTSVVHVLHWSPHLCIHLGTLSNRRTNTSGMSTFQCHWKWRKQAKNICCGENVKQMLISVKYSELRMPLRRNYTTYLFRTEVCIYLNSLNHRRSQTSLSFFPFA